MEKEEFVVERKSTTEPGNSSNTILVLFDLHGTIVCETQEVVGVEPSGKTRRNQLIYPRPDFENLMKTLHDIGFTIGIYSSAMRKNVQFTLSKIFPQFEDYIFHIFDRKYNKKDTFSSIEWDSVRNLDLIWAKYPQFNKNNTIMVDNEARKVRDYPTNSIIVEDFNSLRIVEENNNSYLTILTTYLTSIFSDFKKQETKDISSLLTLKPFNNLSTTFYSDFQSYFSVDKNSMNNMNKSDAEDYFRQMEEQRHREKDRNNSGRRERKKYCDEYVPSRRRRESREDSDKEEKSGRGKYDRYRGKGYDRLNELRDRPREFRSPRYREIRVSDPRIKPYNDRYIDDEYGEELIYDTRYSRYEDPSYNDLMYNRRYNTIFEDGNNLNGHSYRNPPYNNEMIEYNNNSSYNSIYNGPGYIPSEHDPYSRFDPRNAQRRMEYIEPIEYSGYNEIHDNHHGRYDPRHSSNSDSSRYLDSSSSSSRFHNPRTMGGDRYDGRYKRENRVYADRYHGSRYKPYENEVRDDYIDRYEVDNFPMKPNNIPMY